MRERMTDQRLAAAAVQERADAAERLLGRLYENGTVDLKDCDAVARLVDAARQAMHDLRDESDRDAWRALSAALRLVPRGTARADVPALLAEVKRLREERSDPLELCNMLSRYVQRPEYQAGSADDLDTIVCASYALMRDFQRQKNAATPTPAPAVEAR